MQKRQEQFQSNALNSINKYLDPVRAKAIKLYFKGTCAASTVAAIDDLGSIIVKRYGDTQQDRPLRFYVDFANLKAGSELFNSVSGGEFVATITIPFYFNDDTFFQAYNILTGKELHFSYNPNTGNPGQFADLTLTGYAELSERPEFYQMHVRGADQNEGSAINSQPYELGAENMAAVYVDDRGGVITDIGLRVDGEDTFSFQPKDVIEGGTLRDNRIEANQVDLLELPIYTELEPESIFNSSANIKISTSAGGNFEITTIEIDYNEGTQIT